MSRSTLRIAPNSALRPRARKPPRGASAPRREPQGARVWPQKPQTRAIFDEGSSCAERVRPRCTFSSLPPPHRTPEELLRPRVEHGPGLLRPGPSGSCAGRAPAHAAGVSSPLGRLVQQHQKNPASPSVLLGATMSKMNVTTRRRAGGSRSPGPPARPPPRRSVPGRLRPSTCCRRLRAEARPCLYAPATFARRPSAARARTRRSTPARPASPGRKRRRRTQTPAEPATAAARLRGPRLPPSASARTPAWAAAVAGTSSLTGR